MTLLDQLFEGGTIAVSGVRFEATGEFRTPRTGDWYLTADLNLMGGPSYEVLRACWGSPMGPRIILRELPPLPRAYTTVERAIVAAEKLLAAIKEIDK